jgi:hypothetical protein
MLTRLNKGVFKKSKKFITDVFDLPTVSMTPVSHLELRISQRIFEKIRGILRGLGPGETDSSKKPEVDNLIALSF